MEPVRLIRAHGRSFPLRWYLIALILVALIPMVFFAGAIVLNLGREQRMSVERGLQTTVRALAIAVEREVAASIRALEVLATSELLIRGDLAAFHAQSTRAVAAQGVWYVLALTDPSGQLLLNTVRPFGASLPRIDDRDYFRRLLATGRPAVSDLVAGRTTGQLNVTVAVPVRRDGVLRYILFAAIKPEGLGQILAEEKMPEDWIATISDTSQVVIARNRNPARFIGRELIAPLKQAVRAAEEGTGRYPVFDGPDAYSAWRRTPSLGWTVAIGIPVSLVDVPLHRSVWRIGLAGLVVALAAGAVAAVVARRLSRSMGALTASATALGQGDTPTRPPSSIEEIDAVGRSMEVAGSTIAQRTAEVRASQARLKRLVDSSLIGILVGEAEQVTDANDAFLRMVGYSREELLHGKLRWPDLTPAGRVPSVREGIPAQGRHACPDPGRLGLPRRAAAPVGLVRAGSDGAQPEGGRAPPETGGPGGQPGEGRVPRDRVARAAHTAERGPEPHASAATPRNDCRAGPTNPGCRRAEHAAPAAAHRGSPRRVAGRHGEAAGRHEAHGPPCGRGGRGLRAPARGGGQGRRAPQRPDVLAGPDAGGPRARAADRAQPRRQRDQVHAGRRGCRGVPPQQRLA